MNSNQPINQLTQIQRLPLIIAMLPMLLCLEVYWGCASSVTRVPIKIQVESTIDVTKHSGFAVLPFIQAKNSGRQRIASSDETGEEIASLMRIGLGRNQNLDIVSTQDTLRLFTDETADEDLLADVSELVRIGEYFEVDAVIVGSYDFFAVSQPRRHYGKRYSRRFNGMSPTTKITLKRPTSFR